MCTGETLHIIPADGYNASLGQDAVDFRCVVPDEALFVEWLINGDPLNKERGIQFSEGDMTSVVAVEARSENANITLECLAFFRDAPPASSAAILLLIQGDQNHAV